MKILNKIFLLGFVLSTACVLHTNGQGNTLLKRKNLDPRVDIRIDNMKYWREMARLGLVDIAPNVKPPAAVTRPSMITGVGVLNVNSPDVVITTAASQSENSIFVNPNDPNNPLNSNNSFQTSPSSFLGTSGFYSTNGGTTWAGQTTGTGGSNSGDPSAVIGNNGRFYNGFISSGFGQGVAYSTNSGLTWTPVIIAPSGTLDKNHLWIDNKIGSTYEGNLYNSWTIFSGANSGEIQITRSTNDGVSWTTPTVVSSAVSAGSHNQGVNLQTGPNGEVYAVWSIYDSFPSDETALGFTSSTNGGASFATATRIISNIRGIRSTQTGKNMRVNSFPSMAVDISNGPNSGHIYVVWANIGTPGVNTAGSIDVYMIRSTNGGTTWSTPIKVNQDPIGNENYFPWITCDPVTGDLSVIFYSDRNVSSTQVEVFVATSQDGGSTWNDFRVSDVAFTPSPIPGLASGYFGDYLGITARDGVVYPCWTDNRTGTALAYVSPFVMQSSNCPATLTLQNQTIPGFVGQLFQASSTINVAGGSTFFNVEPNGQANIIAGQSIVLGPGFHSKANSNTLVKIGPCTSSPIASPSATRQTNGTVKEAMVEIHQDAFQLYPNPTEGSFTIELPPTTDKSSGGVQVVGVYTLLGTTIMKKEVKPGEKVIVNLKAINQPKGVYLVKYMKNGKVTFKRVVYK
ncbi:hypothetical protein BKI52_23665 [marine bacterium AO1-C]|nr:hypothetical protein BKI52_23665 [marine bacterium AO1-C]